MKKLFGFVLTAVMLFAGISVFAESELSDLLSVIEPPVVGDTGEIKLGEFGLVYEVVKASDNKLDFSVLTSDGKNLNLSAVDKITVIELGTNDNKKYTAVETTEYNFADNMIDSAYQKFQIPKNRLHSPYVVSYTLNELGNIESVYIPGGCFTASERDTNFGVWQHSYWKFNKNSTISTDVPSVEVSYQLYETPIIYGYSYNYGDLVVSVVEESDVQNDSGYSGYIYDMTDDNQVKMMVIHLPDVKYKGAVIDTITPVINASGKNVYKITMYAKGIIRNGQPIVDSYIIQNGTLVQYDITVTKYTESRGVIDNYKHDTIGTDYSNKIASEFYPGAVIYYKENDKGEISGIKKLYPLTSETGKITDSQPYYITEFFTTYNTLPYKAWYTEGCECYVMYGKIAVIRQHGLSNITIDTMYMYEEGDLPQKTLNDADYSKASIQIVDYSGKSDKDKVYIGTSDDLKQGDYVLVRKQLGTTKEIVVYKNFDLERYLGIAPVSNVELDKTTLDLNVGNIDILKASVNPSNAVSKKVSWASSDENVVTVKDGIVTAVGEGTAIITVTTDEGGKTAECKVTVGEKQKMSISDLNTEEGVKFSVNLLPEPKGKVIAALYDETGSLVEAKTVQPAQAKVDFEFSGSGSRVKIIWVDPALRPYTEAIVKEI